MHWQVVELLWLREDFAHSAEKSVIAARSIRGVIGAGTRLGVRLQQQKLQKHPQDPIRRLKSPLDCSRRSRIETL